MTFKELALRDEMAFPAIEMEKGTFQDVLANQGPVISVWFGLMVLNLCLFLFVIH